MQLGDSTYDLRPDAGNTKDLEWNPLFALQPNQEFKYRINEKGSVWVPAPMFKRGKLWKPYHEAKYNVWGQS